MGVATHDHIYDLQLKTYCKFVDFREGFSFVKLKPSKNILITVSSTDKGKTGLRREFLARERPEKDRRKQTKTCE